MLDSDFWRNLANEFRAIDPSGFLRADWQCCAKIGDEPPHVATWSLPGGKLTLSIRLEFEALARRAGRKVHPYMDSLDGWMEALRESGFDTDRHDGVGIESDEHGQIVAHTYFGTISRLCPVSADLCKHYESAALESERMADVQRESQAMAEERHQPARDEPDEAIPNPTTAHLSREERLQAFVSENKTSIAAVYQAAGVHKPNMHQWRRGEIADTSVMAARIESVLNGKTPLVPRGKNLGQNPVLPIGRLGKKP
jgi:hypothetical protein